MNYYNKICEKLNNIALGISNFLLFFSFAMTVLQVLSRYVFKFSFPWIEELSRYLVILMVFLAAGHLLRHNDNPYVEFIIESISGKLKFWLLTVLYLFLTIFLIFLLVNSAEAVLKAANKKTPSLRILWSFPYLSIPLGSFLMVLQMPYLFIKNFNENLKGRK